MVKWWWSPLDCVWQTLTTNNEKIIIVQTSDFPLNYTPSILLLLCYCDDHWIDHYYDYPIYVITEKYLPLQMENTLAIIGNLF